MSTAPAHRLAKHERKPNLHNGRRGAQEALRIEFTERFLADMHAQLKEALGLLRSSDPERIGEALARLQGTVFAFSMKVCGHREDAEDTMQDVLMRSLPHLAKIEDPRALAVWLYTAARNRCWRSRRKGAHAPSQVLSLDDLMPASSELERLLESKETNPEQHSIRKDQQQVLHRAVLTLPPQYRMVLVLHDMEDLDTEQVAKVLGIQPATVRVRLHRARLAVRQAMSVLLEGGEPPAAARRPTSKRGRRSSKQVQSGRDPRCRGIFANLSEYLDGRVEPESCAAMKEHIEACPACVAFILDLSAAIDRCRQFQPECSPAIPARLTELLTYEYLRLTGQTV